MYKHVKEYEIKFTDADAFDNLKPSSLLSFLEESACLSADELGFGYDAITKVGLGFIVVNYYIRLFKPVKLGQKLKIATWPLRPKHLIFFRDFELFSGDEKVGVATSRWCMIDLKSYAMAPVQRFFKEGDFDNYNTERSVVFSSWKIPEVENPPLIYSKLVSYSDYDHYFHVNNTKYADFMADCFTVDEMRGKFISELQVTYSKQCKLGEKLDFYKGNIDNTYFVDGKVGDETRVKFSVRLDEIQI